MFCKADAANSAPIAIFDCAMSWSVKPNAACAVASGNASSCSFICTKPSAMFAVPVITAEANSPSGPSPASTEA